MKSRSWKAAWEYWWGRRLRDTLGETYQKKTLLLETLERHGLKSDSTVYVQLDKIDRIMTDSLSQADGDTWRLLREVMSKLAPPSDSEPIAEVDIDSGEVTVLDKDAWDAALKGELGSELTAHPAEYLDIVSSELEREHNELVARLAKVDQAIDALRGRGRPPKK